MNLEISIPRKRENIKTRNPIQQENVDFKTLFRYKKSLHRKRRSLLMGFSGGFKQGKPGKALLELEQDCTSKTQVGQIDISKRFSC
jgi:hypothetical protein